MLLLQMLIILESDELWQSIFGICQRLLIGEEIRGGHKNRGYFEGGLLCQVDRPEDSIQRISFWM